MKTSAKKIVQLLVEQSVNFGLRDVVISPGSRNAPLIIAFNQHPKIKTHVVPDERSAAFVAIGIAQQSQDLVGILCTSGSAAANYYPAVVEAFYQRVPLLVFTADRPAKWINQGDGQTIMQEHMFGQHVNAFLQLDENQINTEIEASIEQTIISSSIPSKGPVHFNIAFEEPLYESEEILEKFIDKKEKLNPIQHNINQFDSIETCLIACKKIMILVGQLNKNKKLNAVLSSIAKHTDIVVLTEHLSNQYDPEFISCIDRTLNKIPTEHEKNYYPDMLITIGTTIVSKRIKGFLRKYKVKKHISVGFDFPEMNTYEQDLIHLNNNPIEFLSFLNSTLKLRTPQSNYKGIWKKLDYEIKDKLSESSVFDEFSDLSAINYLVEQLPKDIHLHLGNSSIIRYLLLFEHRENTTYWCNRGTSGIDGSTSTALGHALKKNNEQHVLIVGDMSFFYDSNAFWNHINKTNLKIIVLNNGGGSIFKIIPGPDTTDELHDFFVFNNNFSIEKMAKSFDISFHFANNLQLLSEKFNEFIQTNQCCILEINTSQKENENILKKYFELLKK